MPYALWAFLALVLSIVAVPSPGHAQSLTTVFDQAHALFAANRAAEAGQLIASRLAEIERLALEDFQQRTEATKDLEEKLVRVEDAYLKVATQADADRFMRSLDLITARYGTFATDALGASIPVVRLLDLKFRDRALFHAGLEMMIPNDDPTGFGCRPKEPRAACAAGKSAGVMRGLGVFSAAIEFDDTRLESLSTDKELASLAAAALVDVAEAAVSVNFPARADQYVKRVDTGLLTPKDHARLLYVQAALAYLRLDDEAAKSLIAAARSTDASVAPLDYTAYAPPAPPCPSCDRADLQRAAREFRDRMAAPVFLVRDPDTNRLRVGESGHEYQPIFAAFLTIARHYRTGLVGDLHPDDAVRRMRSRYPWLDERMRALRKATAGRRSDLDIMRAIAVTDRYALTQMIEGQPTASLLVEPSRSKALALAERSVKDIHQESVEFGADVRFFESMAKFSSEAEQIGSVLASEMILQSALEIGLAEGPSDYVRRLQIERADLFLDMWSRLALHRANARRAADAHRALGRAREIAFARIRENAHLASDDLLQLLRRIKPSLTRMANASVAVARLGGNGAGLASRNAFGDLQLATMGELAASAHSTLKRQIFEAAGVEGKLAARDAAQQELRHLKGLLHVSALVANPSLRERIAETERRLAELNRAVAGALPSAELFLDSDLLRAEDVQKTLSPGELFIQLHASDTAVLGVALGATGAPVAWRSNIKSSDLETLISDVRRGLDASARNRVFPLDKAHRLYGIMFGGLGKQMASAKRIVVVSDGPLASVPLASLVVRPATHQPTQPSEYRTANIPWLIRQVAIAIAPSARSFVIQRSAAAKTASAQAFLGVGNPALAPPDIATRSVRSSTEILQSNGLADASKLRSLSSLPETQDELEKIASRFGPDRSMLLVGAAATEERVRASDLERYRIVAFATHGLVAGEGGIAPEPGLVLTPPGVTSGRENDGFLAASEILKLRLNADLVILSACNTAAADGRPRAEGLSGLAKAFMAAGAKGLLITHFAIPSDSAVAITTGMIEAHASGGSMDWAQALQRSMITLIDTHEQPGFADPVNWAAYAVVGAAR